MSPLFSIHCHKMSLQDYPWPLLSSEGNDTDWTLTGIQHQGCWHFIWIAMHTHTLSQSFSLFPKMTLADSNFQRVCTCAREGHSEIFLWGLLVLTVPDICSWTEERQNSELLGILNAASSPMMGLKLLFIKWQSLDLQFPGSIARSSVLMWCYHIM